MKMDEREKARNTRTTKRVDPTLGKEMDNMDKRVEHHEEEEE